jgi:tetratricopeptide (TPR) repeat protein
VHRWVNIRSLTLAAVLGLTACGGSGYEVVRVHAGRAKPGRFVSSVAYAASLEASIAEERGDWGRAAELLKRARDEDPDGPELGARLGLALCHLGKVQAGMFAIDDALRVDPDLERAYTSRARCRLLSKGELAAVRSDLVRALQADADALEPALLLVELDLRESLLKQARLRAEEVVVLHPRSARALRVLAEVAARQGDSKRAVAAALEATTLDDATGAIAKSAATDAADRSGVSAYSLALRGSAPSSLPTTDAVDATCEAKLRAFEQIASRAEPSAVETAAEGMRSACPELDATITRIEVVATWTPKTAEVVEARALSALSAEARRFGARMRLRRKSTDELLDANELPRAEDRATLAIHLAAAGVRKVVSNSESALALATAAYDLAPAEPTVARLVGEVARRLNKPGDHPWRTHACTLARTTIEKQACG